MTDDLTELYQNAINLFGAGQLEDALRQFEAYLQQRPSSGKAWNDAGTVLFRLGRVDESIRYFQRSLEQEDRSLQAYRNLICAYLRQQQPEQALRWLKTVDQEVHSDVKLAIRIAEEFERQSDLAASMETLQYGRRLPGPIEVLEQQMARLRTKRAKIAFFCGGDGPTFLKDIMDYARQRYQVRYYEGQTSGDVSELMQWSDISWFEWCTELAQIGTNLPKVCSTIVRLHRYEAYLSWPRLVNWENVDTLITVGNSWVIEAMKHWCPDIEKRVSIIKIPNGVDVDKFKFKRRTRGKNIAFAASLRMVKNPMLLVHCMAELLKHDPEYHLFYAGTSYDLLLQQYLEYSLKRLGIAGSFHFDGFQNDMTQWLHDKHYLVSTSVIESQGMGILEAMAVGIKPVVHDFPGAEETFGKKYLFATPQEFCRKILEDDYDSEEYRQFVERKYPLNVQLLKINELFAGFETQIGAGLTADLDTSRIPDLMAAV